MRRERPQEEPKRDYCNFLASYLDSVYELQTEEEQANALFGVLEYMIYDIEPQDLSGGAAILFRMARPLIDRTIRKQAVNRENGKKPKRSQVEAKSKPSRSETKPSRSETKPEREKEREKEKEKDKDKDIGVRNKESAREEGAPPASAKWITYRHEQGDDLTTTQIEAIREQVSFYIAKYGEQAVDTLIGEMIAEGRNVIFFDRLEKKNTDKFTSKMQAVGLWGSRFESN